MKTNDIHQIIYVSKATSRFSSEQLTSLLKTARRNNSVSNITGLLLYNGVGTFLQVIEGPESVLKSLMSKIKADNRHIRIDTLFRGSVNGRYFPDWKMGFRDLSKHSPITIEGFSDFMEETNTQQFINHDPVFAFRLINHFKNNQYRGVSA